MTKRILSLALCLCVVIGLASGIGFAEDKELTKLTMFIDHSWYPVESFTGIIPEVIKEKTGIDLEVTVAINGEQLGVMLGANELPDIVYTQNMVDRCSDGSLFFSYEELVEKYCPEWEISDKQWGIARGYSTDGKAYTILNHYSEKKDWEHLTAMAVPMVGSLLMRGDILDALGEAQPTNLDEMFELFGKVKEAYPDMTPLKINENWNTLVFRYLIGIGGTDYVQQEDGSYVHYSLDPRYEELMLWFNQCYLAGYVIPDDPYFVKGSTAIADGKWFASCACTQNGLPGTNATLAGLDPSFYAIEMVPFEQSNYLTSDTGWSASFIPLTCSNPEAAIKFIAWMFTEEGQKISQMGREGVEYTLTEDGLPVFSQEWKDAIAAGEHNNIYNPWFYMGGSEIVEATTRCATTDPKYVADCYEVIREKFDNWPWIMAALPKGDIDEKFIQTKVGELCKTNEAKMILAASQEEAQEVYAEYLDNLERVGMDQLETYVNDRIMEIMPQYQ